MINMDQYKPRLFWELKFLEIYFQGQVPLFKGFREIHLSDQKLWVSSETGFIYSGFPLVSYKNSSQSLAV
jgi:hypothetical protein